jgi:hypothetical protein
MVRELLGAAATLLALPALLAAQTPKTPSAGAVRGTATRFLGEVVRPADAARTSGDVAHNPNEGNQADDQKDAQEGPDVDEGPNEGTDVDNGPDVHEGHDVNEGPNGASQAQGEGDEQNGSDTPPPAPGQNRRVGRHKP